MRPRARTRGQGRRRNKSRTKTRRTQRGGSLGRAPVVYTPSLSIQKVWVITIDPKGRRMRDFNRLAIASHIPYTVFEGVRGAELNVSKNSPLPSLGIGKVIYTSRGSNSEPRNLGTIGCFLSHRNLYEKIVKDDNDLNACHMVLEDDVIFPRDILDIFLKTFSDIPEDWDIIYFSKGGKFVGDKVTDVITKLRKTVDSQSNFGTWGQIYRVGFLKEKMLPYLETMSEELDSQINRKFDEWNAYCYNPPLMLINPNGGSVIEHMD